MPAYELNPTPTKVIIRTNTRISTVRGRLRVLSSDVSDGRAAQYATEATNNLRMLLDARETGQVLACPEHAAKFDAKLAELRSQCDAFRLGQLLEPHLAEALNTAIAAFLASPVSSGRYFSGGSRAAVPQPERPVEPPRVESKSRGTSGSLPEVPAVSVPTALTTPAGERREHQAPAPPATTEAGARPSPPGAQQDTLALILRDEARCKAAATCPRLPVRSRFHEPNVETLATWRERDGFYRNGIDRRVVFICESPSQTPDPPAPDFVVEGVAGYRCWSGYNARNTQHFTELRQQYGFEHCFITNVVKCGVRKDKPDARETALCSRFLWRELSLIQPHVLAVLGVKTLELLMESMNSWPTPNASSPVIIRIQHYSVTSRGTTEAELQRRWANEMAQVQAALRARGQPVDAPVLMPVPLGRA